MTYFSIIKNIRVRHDKYISGGEPHIKKNKVGGGVKKAKVDDKIILEIRALHELKKWRAQDISLKYNLDVNYIGSVLRYHQRRMLVPSAENIPID